MPNKKNKKKARRNTARQQKRYDTPDAQDGPPPSVSVDGNDSENGADEDMDDSPPTPPLVPENRPEVGDWVIDIIRTFPKDKGNDVVDKLFLTDEPNFKDVHNFFREVNDNIRAANMVHGTEDVRVGEILAHTYEVMYQSWKMELAKPEVENNPSEAWNAYDKVYQALDYFNREYNLPLGWNISASAAEQAFGPRLSSEVPVTPISQGESSDLESSGDEGSETGSEDKDQSGDDYTPSAIDLLEARAWKEERSLTGAKVLFWWSKGTGTQFVRYGSKSKPIFRIRAGSHEYYDKKRVTRVLSRQNRGYMKRPEVIDGIPGETWKYGRRDVFNILGVGWKIKGDDDETDGEITLETGAFVRRIANGSILDGDRLVYQKAKELEEAYTEDNRAADLGGNEEDEEIIEGGGVEKAPPFRGKSPPRSVFSFARSHRSGKSNVRSEDDADEASEPSGHTAIRASKKSSLGPTIALRGVKERGHRVFMMTIEIVKFAG
ncbi:hypothetical protein ETB97_005010 [Aspergillus alliaceus]|uniref:Uncharacterized protein n=1 Tax=Petromyces alliaceus TaxID=209559 RepID=A0A8H5ZZ73_PETAA|nr:hypothetical protein ETB97_005010 [Aspergillus burnettii]